MDRDRLLFAIVQTPAVAVTMMYVSAASSVMVTTVRSVVNATTATHHHTATIASVG